MIYFDNAATSFPKPSAVTKEVVRCLNTYCGNPGRSSHRMALLAAEKIYQTREKVASLINLKTPENVVFTYNATYALNMAIYSEAQPNSHILISDMEHNSVYRPVYKLKKEGVCDFDVFSSDGDVIENITSLLRKNTSLLICTHVSNVSGRILPIEKIGALCKRRKIRFIVDASQSIGHTETDVEKIGCDILCAPAHKGLFGIQGAGFAAFRSARKAKALIVGGSGVSSLSPIMPDTLPEKLEAGTLSTPAIAALNAGIDYINEVKIEEIEKRERILRTLTLERLKSTKGVKVYDEERECSNLVSFSIDGFSPSLLGKKLDDVGICVRSGFHCSPLAHKALGSYENGSVRISLGYFNTVNEIDTFYKSLKEIIK